MIKRESSLLLCIDIQERLMPAIDGASDVIGRTQKLVEIARQMNIPRLFTEQNPNWLGSTVAELDLKDDPLLRKRFFDASAEEAFPPIASDIDIVVTGSEAHVCVLHTVMGLLGQGRNVYVVQDAIGSRRREDKGVAIQRMAKSGAEIVTYEMVAFEWLRTMDDPLFRPVLKMIK
jgi:nicotinamidase-related amidase